mgnify:CR=1 FL=1
MKFNMIFKFLKDNFLHLLGYSTLLVMVIVLCGRACSASAVIEYQQNMINELIALREETNKVNIEEEIKQDMVDNKIISKS